MINRKIESAHIDKKRSFILLFILLAIYMYENLDMPGFIGADVNLYIIKTIIWGSLLFIVIKMPKLKTAARGRTKNTVSLWAFSSGVVYILSLMGVAFFMGVGKTPYSQSVRSIIFNFFSFGIPVIVIEFTRSYLISNSKEKNKWLMIIITAIIMSFIQFRLSRFMSISDLESLAKFMGNYGLEALTLSLMASYLAYLGGVKPALIYMGIRTAFEYLSPLLPDLQWLVRGLIACIVPMFSLSIIHEVFQKQTKSREYMKEMKNTKKESTLGWMVTLVLSIGIIWFSVGVFPIYPEVIVTGSMEPMIKPGDMAIYKEVDAETRGKLKEGDIIHFKRDKIYITHRIIKVEEQEGKRVYVTKGDNNSGPDVKRVQKEDIKGTYLMVIPKIGWPTLIIKSDDKVDREEVEF